MVWITVAVLCFSVLVVSCAWWLVIKVFRARSKGRLMARSHGMVAAAPDFIGISAVSHDIDSIEQIDDLLEVEYPRYELVVVIDARVKPELFQQIIRHYKMLRVDYQPLEACSSVGLRGLYRSELRGMNRLVMLDQMEIFMTITSDVAIGAATYDYILKIPRGRRLTVGAIERLAMELGEHRMRSVAMIRTGVGLPLRLYCRESADQYGHFGALAWRRIPREDRITIWEPLFYSEKRMLGLRLASLAGLLAVFGLMVFMWLSGNSLTTLLLLDLVVLWALVVWIAFLSFSRFSLRWS